MTDTDISTREKLRALRRIVSYRPLFTILIIFLSVFAAVLEGVGISFLLPIIEVVQSSGNPGSDAGGFVSTFIRVYQFLGIPFTLEFIIVGIAVVMTVRYLASFGVAWLREVLRINYIKDLQTKGFENALDAQVAYFDSEGSDDILNAIVTQTEYAGRAIKRIVLFFEQLLLGLMYLIIAFYLAPFLTIFTAVTLGGLTYFFRFVLEPGYAIGDRVADANERIQETVQAGTQGVRDVKLFGMSDELFRDFQDAVNQFAESFITLQRNKAGLNKFYQLASALTVFVLIYAALRFASLSIGALGVFLFAMFRLAPRVSNLNSRLYQIEGDLPHLIRTLEFVEKLQENEEIDHGSKSPPRSVETIAYENVSFSYPTTDRVLKDISFEVQSGEYIAFVGESGGGKSTIISLLARMYEPDSGQITANGIPIHEFDLKAWRSKIAVVRQNPFIFNDTLRYNLTIGNRDVSNERIHRACEIACVAEFLNDLSDGYDTVLGDDGVQLSGGQRQRVALARALLKDADLLILDEATSDLDSSIEQEVQAAIESMDPDYAILTIAHRLSTVKNADRIYTIEEGEILESGPHEELITNDNTYADLYSLQSNTRPNQ